MSAEMLFKGSLRAAVSFVILELLLLPLFEYTCKSLTIAIIRNRIAKKYAFGLLDGLSGDSRFFIVPRALNIVFKMA